MNKYVKHILSMTSAIVLCMLGIVTTLVIEGNSFILVLFFIALAMPPLLYFVSWAGSKLYVRSRSPQKLLKWQKYLKEHMDKADSVANDHMRILIRMHTVSIIYTVLLWVTAAAISFLGGLLAEAGLAPLIILYSYCTFLAIYSRLLAKNTVAKEGQKNLISKEEYPLIYSMANKARDELKCVGNISVLLITDDNISILKEGNTYLLQIGITPLNILSEDELYALILHEFAHECNTDKRTQRVEKYISRISDQNEDKNPVINLLANIYALPDCMYLLEYTVYNYASTIVTAYMADKAMGSAEVAVSALLKLNYLSFYSWENEMTDEPSIYESDKLRSDYFTQYISKFKCIMEQRHDAWNELTCREIPANNSIHPTIKMRADKLGVSDIRTKDTVSSEEYQTESKKALELTDKLVYEARKDSYSECRNSAYIQPLSIINEWEASGSKIAPETYADVLNAYRSLVRFSDAETLADKVIASLPVESTYFACFIKGNILLHRYDASGIDYMYKAMENNNAYIEKGLETIGMFCCITGREKELAEYRVKAMQLYQEDTEIKSKANFLSKNDNLSAEHMPEGMKKDILDYILSADTGIIKNIYLVRKTVSEDFFTSVFIIHFCGGTDEERDAVMHKIFVYLDSYPVKWQFSLFDFFDFPNVNIRAIEGSLVYSKEEN